MRQCLLPKTVRILTALTCGVVNKKNVGVRCGVIIHRQNQRRYPIVRNLLHDPGVVPILLVGQAIAELAARVDGVRVI